MNTVSSVTSLKKKSVHYSHFIRCVYVAYKYPDSVGYILAVNSHMINGEVITEELVRIHALLGQKKTHERLNYCQMPFQKLKAFP